MIDPELIAMVIVMALIVSAAVLSTPKGRLPLAIRGLAKLLKKEQNPTLNTHNSALNTREAPVPTWRKVLAFILVIIALLLAIS